VTERRDRTPLPAALVRRGIGQRKGEDVLHPRLGRGRSLETDTTCQYCNTEIFGQPSLFCFEHPSAEFGQHSACFVVTDSGGQKLIMRRNPAGDRQLSCSPVTKQDALQANIAKLPDLQRKD
jgi:hypothetical protein